MEPEKGIWSSLLNMAGMGAVSGGLELGGDLLSNLLGKSGIMGSTSESLMSGQVAADAQQKWVDTLKGNIPELLQKSLYSAAGTTGESGSQLARQKIEGLLPTSRAMKAYTGMNKTADDIVGQAKSSADASRLSSSLSDKQTRQSLLDSTKGSMAGKAAMLNKFGDVTGQNRLKAQQEAGNQIVNATAQRGNLLGMATDVLNKDRQTMFETNVKPYLMENSQMGSQLFSPNTGGATSAATSQAEGEYVSNPLGTLSRGASTLALGDIDANQQASVIRKTVGSGINRAAQGGGVEGVPSVGSNTTDSSTIEPAWANIIELYNSIYPKQGG